MAELTLLELQSGKFDGGVYRRGNAPEFCDVSTQIITTGRFQPRTDFGAESLDGLRESIATNGLLTHLLVFINEGQQLELLAVERRLRCAIALNMRFVPVRILEVSLEEAEIISLLDNIQRESLSPLDEGMSFERIVQERGMSEAKLAKRIGKSRGYIQQRRAVARAHEEVIQSLRNGAITFTQARTIAQSGDGDYAAQKHALDALLASGGNYTEEKLRECVFSYHITTLARSLKKLGWSCVGHDQHGMIVWGGNQKPQHLSVEEIEELIKKGEKPLGSPPTPSDWARVGDDNAYHKCCWYLGDVQGLVKPWRDHQRLATTTYMGPGDVSKVVEQVDVMVEQVRGQGYDLQWGEMYPYLFLQYGQSRLSLFGPDSIELEELLSRTKGIVLPAAPAAAPAPTAVPIAPTAVPIAPTAVPIAPTAAPIAPAPTAPTAAPAPTAPTAAPASAPASARADAEERYAGIIATMPTAMMRALLTRMRYIPPSLSGGGWYDGDQRAQMIASASDDKLREAMIEQIVAAKFQ